MSQTTKQAIEQQNKAMQELINNLQDCILAIDIAIDNTRQAKDLVRNNLKSLLK